MMLARQPVEGERLLDCFLDPSDEPRITHAPFGDLGGEVAAGLLDGSPVVNLPRYHQQTKLVAEDCCALDDSGSSRAI